MFYMIPGINSFIPSHNINQCLSVMEDVLTVLSELNFYILFR